MGRNKQAPQHKKPGQKLTKEQFKTHDGHPAATKKPVGKAKKPLTTLSLDTVLTESDVESLLRILSSSSEDCK